MRGNDAVMFVLMALAVVALILLATYPFYNANRRNHPNKSAILALTLFGYLFFPLWLVALVWSFTGPDKSATPADSGPGEYLVIGVHKATQQDTQVPIEAASAAAAKVKGELNGLVVTEVRFLHKIRPPQPAFPVVHPAKPRSVKPIKKPDGYTGAKSLNFPD